MNQVLKENSAFSGMQVSTHYQYYVVPGVVVYDLRELSFRQTPIDVHTAFLEFAKKLKAKRYSQIKLSYQGMTKYSISICSNSRVRKMKLPGVISLRNERPAWAIPNGSLSRIDWSTFSKLTNMAWAVSGLR